MSYSFQQTRWTLIEQIKSTDIHLKSKATNTLCALYWKPLYAFARRQGSSPEDSADSVQSFLAKTVKNEDFSKAQYQKGKLRTFLLHLFKRHRSDELKKESALKRGGAKPLLSLDTEEGEKFLTNFHSLAASENFTDEFDLLWAETIFSNALQELKAECIEKERGELFLALLPRLSGENSPSINVISQQLGKEPNSIRVSLHRLRGRLLEHLKNAVASTVTTPEELKQELRYLAQVLSKSKD